MKNINTNVLYGVIGLLIGIIITSGFCMMNRNRGYRSEGDMYSKNKMMHKMPDGSMMPNTGMGMHDMMSGMMAGLEGKKGDDFDKAFLAEMIVHHQGAVQMAQMVLESSKKPELIKLANDIISAQNSEITMMQNWQKAWFK
jgi:uncharacterized protein (DUF305 family)